MVAKKKSKITAMITAFMMVFVMMPQFATPAHAADVGLKEINVSANPIKVNGKWDGSGYYIYYGAYKDNPVKYRVLARWADEAGTKFSNGTPTINDFNVDALLLDSDKALFTAQFDSGSSNNSYGSSALGYSLRDGKDPDGNTLFSSLERPKSVYLNLSPEKYKEDNLWFEDIGRLYCDSFILSAAEVMQLYKNESARKKTFIDGNTSGYWLRSAGVSSSAYDYYVGSINFQGTIGYSRPNTTGRVAPAFLLDTSKILFTQTTAFDKTTGLKKINGASAKEFKVTLWNNELTVTAGKLTGSDQEITVPYSCQAGSGRRIDQVSIVITSGDISASDSTILYYGKLGNPSDTSGTFTLPSDLPDGFKAYIMAEEINGSQFTDFASKAQKLEFPHTEDEHVLEFVDFTWTGNENDGYTKVEANFKCESDDGYTKSVRARIRRDLSNQTPATCTTDGRTPFVAVLDAADSPDGSTHEETREVNLPKAIGAGGLPRQHDYEFASFTWKGLETRWPSAAANYVCKRDRSHSHEITADISVSEEVPATCTTDGMGTYTATIPQSISPDNIKHTDTKQVIIKAYGHNDHSSRPEYLDEDHHRFICKRCEETITVDHTWDKKTVIKPATCTENGRMLYTCSCNATKEEDINAGHKYGAWGRLNDMQHHRICENDPEHVETEEHTWDVEILKEATATTTGIKTSNCTKCIAYKTEAIPITGSGDAAIAKGADILSYGSNKENAQTIYMADTAWRVIGYGGQGVAGKADVMTLIDSGALKTSVKFRVDSSASDANHYSASDLKIEIEKLTGTENIFSNGEKAGIVPRTLKTETYIQEPPYSDGIAGTEVKNALLWPLSTKEAYTMNKELRKGASRWWLRSPGDYNYYAAIVSGDGNVYYYGLTVDNLDSVRPAFHFNLESVILTSSAVGGKSDDVGESSLAQVGKNTAGEWKLTLKDAAHKSFKVDSVSTACEAKTVQIGYSRAATGDGEYISAVITDASGAVKYYGKLKKCGADSDASGTVTVDLDGKLKEGDTFCIFNEQCNDDKKTDYASELKEIEVSFEPHDWGNWTKIDATSHRRICKKDPSHVETKNHTWDAGTVKEPATCYNTGTMLYTCTVCKGTKEETININQNGHQYGVWTNLNTTQHQRVCELNNGHVEKANHIWDAGKETKQATTTETGVKIYTCTACKGTKTETIPKLQDQMGTDGTAVGTGASSLAAEKAITTLKKDADPKGAVFARIQLKSPSQTKTSVKISWKKTSGATKYVIYGNACGTKNKMKKLATVTGTSKNFTKVGGKKVKKGTYYKFMVVALDKNNKVVSTSKMIHVATKGGKVGNHKNVTVKAKISGKTKAVSKVTLKKGKILALKTTLNPVSKKLKVKKHVGVRYESSNSKIATVNGSGKITAKAKGTCYIYAYAQNGVVKAVKVTVK